MAAEVWRRFTPTQVDPHKCQARTWGGGFGGQCRQACMRGKDLCRAHFKQESLAHGRVDECPAYWKLQQFLSAERRRAQAEREEPKEPKPRGSRRDLKGLPHWYTRHAMWHFASRLEGGFASSLEELDPDQYNACLRAVSAHYKCHRQQREYRNGRG